MQNRDKIMRTVRVHNDRVPGTLAHLLLGLGDLGVELGEIRLIQESARGTIRDITFYVNNEQEIDLCLQAITNNPGTDVMAVRDEVLELHQKGKIAIRSRCEVDSLTTLRKVYTPGVAEVCLKIAANPALARQYTATSHFVAIVTDGTAVLGLGDIGPLAGMPVMEGKAMLMETLVGLSGMPILLNTHDVDVIVETVVTISPTFAAIQLEDIAAPRCFEIEERLIARLKMPVMHDDQHGTATVVTAALTNACRQTGIRLEKAQIGQVGLGAAGNAIGEMLMKLTGNSNLGADINPQAVSRFVKNGGRAATLAEVMAESDIVIATTGAAGLIKPEMVRKGQIILALSNPNPEIDPEVAMQAGAKYAADGKSVNNVLGFPGILRGAVDTNAMRISHEMYFAAAETIADLTPENELVPNPLDKKVHQAVAHAVALKAKEQGLAQEEFVPMVDL